MAGGREGHRGRWGPIHTYLHTTISQPPNSHTHNTTKIQYADNLLKGFATSISIVLSCMLSLLLFDDFTLSLQFLAGTATVIASTLAYSAQPGALSLRSLLSYIPAGSPLRGALQEFQKRQERAYHRGSDDGVHIMDTEGGEEQGSVV